MIDEPDCSPTLFSSSKKAIAHAEMLLGLEDYVTLTKTTNISSKGCYKVYLVEEVNTHVEGYDLKRIYVNEVHIN